MTQDAQVAQGSSTATPQIVSDTDDLVLEMPVGPPPPVPVVPGLQGSRIVVDNIPEAPPRLQSSRCDSAASHAQEDAGLALYCILDHEIRLSQVLAAVLLAKIHLFPGH